MYAARMNAGVMIYKRAWMIKYARFNTIISLVLCLYTGSIALVSIYIIFSHICQYHNKRDSGLVG